MSYFSLLTSAHKKKGDKYPLLQCLKKHSEESEMCHYCYIILKLNLLIFARSIREKNFIQCVSSLQQDVKWCYACDHHHYARWVTVHLYDLVNLPCASPYLYKCFSDGCFAFQKTNRKYSLMALDLAHEQNNAVIKRMCGATSVLIKNDEFGLARWKLCLRELSPVINEYESTLEVELDSETFKQNKDKDIFVG